MTTAINRKLLTLYIEKCEIIVVATRNGRKAEIHKIFKDYIFQVGFHAYKKFDNINELFNFLDKKHYTVIKGVKKTIIEPIA